MSLPADKKIKIYSVGNVSGGVNINDPAISLKENQAQDCLNLILLQSGCIRWPGCVNLTAKDAVNDYFRGMYYSSEISGSGHLFAMWGGKLYEITVSDGSISAALYDATGSGELWGATQWGKFYGTNGAGIFKVETSTASRLGLVAPAAGAAIAAVGGSLPDGVYKVKIGYSRKVGGLNVLYSQCYDLGSVTLGTGNNSIAISSFANSADPQVNNKVVWMTLAGGTTYYFFYETGNNTTTSFTISDDTAYENAIVYEQFSLPSGLPPAMTGLIIADNRIFGYLGNYVYYSLKAQNGYDLERFPTLNKIEYPFQITGLFNIGQYLYINTASNGVIIQSLDDLGSRFEQFEFKTSFKYMRTVVDWNGGKLGLTQAGLQFFDGQKFLDFDYSFNIRPVIRSMYTTADDNFQPVACIINRDNRIEYHLSFRNTLIGSVANNRTYVLNLSQTFYQDNENFKTPWEILGRGFNYSAKTADGVWFFAQSKESSSTIFKELSTHTTQVGIYNDAGTYIDTAENMPALLITKNRYENLFSKVEFEEIALLMQAGSNPTVGIVIADTVGVQSFRELSIIGGSQWDISEWDIAQWTPEVPGRYKAKCKRAIRGYTWNFKFIQTADDINFKLNEVEVLAIVETGRGI